MDDILDALVFFVLLFVIWIMLLPISSTIIILFAMGYFLDPIITAKDDDSLPIGRDIKVGIYLVLFACVMIVVAFGPHYGEMLEISALAASGILAFKESGFVFEKELRFAARIMIMIFGMTILFHFLNVL